MLPNKKQRTALGIFGFGVLVTSMTTAYAAPNNQQQSIWPTAQAGYKQVMIQLPEVKDESLLRVELVPEKRMKTDCNLVMIHGEMISKDLVGWGYNYYILNVASQSASTRMACPSEKMVKKQVPIHLEMPFLQYNHKLPIVVYIPKDINLLYRVWSAGNLQQASSK